MGSFFHFHTVWYTASISSYWGGRETDRKMEDKGYVALCGLALSYECTLYWHCTR